MAMALLAAIAACEDDDFNDCAEVGDRGGPGLIAKCGEFPEGDGGGQPTRPPPPWDPDATRPNDGDEDTAVDAGAVECRSARDCGAAPQGFACQSCMDGSKACPEPACVEGTCAISVPKLCPELERAFACETDDDCANRGCIHQCEDGTPACIPSPCSDGVCAPRFSTCGHGGDDPCPSGTAGFYVCTACGPSGGCGTLTLRCSQSCNQVVACSDPTTRCDLALSVCVPSQFSGCI